MFLAFKRNRFEMILMIKIHKVNIITKDFYQIFNQNADGGIRTPERFHAPAYSNMRPLKAGVLPTRLRLRV